MILSNSRGQNEMSISRFTRYAALFGLTVLLVSGCTDRQQLKEEWQQAAAKQEQALSYQFSGELDLQLDASLFEGAPPLTAGLLSVFKESRIAYSGIASLNEPVQLEADVKLTPKGADSGLELPILLKDNKLYLHMPAVNKTDEFFMLPLGSNADRLKNTGRMSASVSGKLLQAANPDWLESSGNDEPLAGGETAKHISMLVTDKNKQQAASYLAAVLPAIADEWLSSGLIGEAQAKAWKEASRSLQVTAPSSLETWIDSQGFIRQQKAQLRFTLKEGGAVHAIQWTHRIDAVNQPQTFEKETPKLLKNTDEILRLLPKASPN